MRLRSSIPICAISLLLCTAAGGENPPANPVAGNSACNSAAASQFDFWIGEWNLTWSDSLHGKNSVSKSHDGCVIEEKFTAEDGSGFTGMSVSVFDTSAQIWKQTWVDNSGSYLDFTGHLITDKSGDRMILSRSFARKDGRGEIHQRMVFHDITRDSLVWDWQSSTDTGKTWTNNWTIIYRRTE